MNNYINLWGIVCQDRPAVGATVEVTTKSGKVKKETVSAVTGRDKAGAWICTVGEPIDATRDNAAFATNLHSELSNLAANLRVELSAAKAELAYAGKRAVEADDQRVYANREIASLKALLAGTAKPEPVTIDVQPEPEAAPAAPEPAPAPVNPTPAPAASASPLRVSPSNVAKVTGTTEANGGTFKVAGQKFTIGAGQFIAPGVVQV